MEKGRNGCAFVSLAKEAVCFSPLLFCKIVQIHAFFQKIEQNRLTNTGESGIITV
jgi:hypothetical protein